jgi:7-cyano-7-deazaguanine synthase
MRVVNLVSGGLDSYIAWRLYGHTQSALNLFVHLGHKYEKKELGALEDLKAADPYFKYEVCVGAPIGNLEDPYTGIIPLRNAELILNAAQFGNVIFMGVLRDELNSDKSPEFMSAMQTVLNISWRPQYWNYDEGRQYVVTSPIREFSKTELVARFCDDGNAPIKCLLKTVSCYSGSMRHCGECASCFKRWVAFTNNDLTDDFVADPLRWAERTGVIKKAENNEYPRKRNEEILNALRRASSRSPVARDNSSSV